MGYTNSSMVAYTKLSPNHSGQRTHAIDRISPHCVVGQCTAEGLGDWFYKTSTQASSNYGIDKNGRVGLYVEEKNRSWCTSSNANDQRAITIECASDTTEPYTMNNTVYETLIKLCTDICKRNGKKKLLWFADKDKSLNYTGKIAMIAGERLSYLKPEEQEMVMEAAENTSVYPSPAQAGQLKGMSEEGMLSEGSIYALLVKKEGGGQTVTISSKKIRDYFPPAYTKEQIEEVIYSLLDQWKQGKEGELNAGDTV